MKEEIKTERTSAQSGTHGLNARKIASIAMFCAIAYVVVCISKLIPVNVAGFLNLDFKDVVIVIGGLILGPLPAVFISAFVSLVEMLTISSTGPVGLLMNVLSTCAFACPAAILYQHRAKFSRAVVGLVTGVLLMTVVMMLWNYLITPLYMGVSRDVVASMLLPVFLPFNLLKGGMNAALTILFYKPIINALRAAKLVPSHEKTGGELKGSRSKLGVIILALVVVVTCALLLLVMSGII